MDHIAGGMKSLCEDIITGRGDRKSTIQQLKGEAEALRDNTRKFLADSKKFHEEMGKDLKEALREGKEDLIHNVNALREDFRKREKEVRADLAEASNIWKKMEGTLRNKKTKTR
jgi:molecular chaperone GrpE (heat shock protein)